MQAVRCELKTCEHCGGTFDRRSEADGGRERPYRWRKRRFCSRACAFAGRTGTFNGSDSPWTVEPSGCWVWARSLSEKGYGKVRRGSRCLRAHRWMYERERGPIPPGLELDHVCRNRACVNPDHLELVTHRENLRRGVERRAT